MALHNIDIENALRRVADRRIEAAMEEGKFDNFAGRGQPLELDEPPVGENARMTWWALRILKNADFTPREVVWRKQIDGLTDKLRKLNDESQLEDLVNRINQLAHQLNTLGTNAIALPVAPLDLESERFRFHHRWAKP
jgi:hypothetical protein